MKILKSILIVSILTIFVVSNVYASEDKFTDIKKHWAEKTIEKFWVNGVVNGYDDNTFKPDANITTAEFLKIIIVVGKYDLIRVGNVIWPDFYINTAVANELIDTHLINCNDYITRSEACKIIGNFINVEETKMAKNKFKDLSDDEDVVLKLVQLGVVGGYKDKTFKGENYLSRAEALTIIERAIDKKEELVKSRKYDVYNNKFSNYKIEGLGVTDVYLKNKYEIKEENIYIYDSGRYANLDGYQFSGELIETYKIINLIQALINEKAYVSVLYQPSKYTINQLQILYGDSKEKIECMESDFSITFFENKYYELSRISMEDKFSNEVFAKIEVTKLWDDYSEFNSGKTIDSFKKNKLKLALNAICKNDAERICNYITQKYKENLNEKTQSKEFKEHKVFNNYIVDFYKKENGVPTFYISKR